VPRKEIENEKGARKRGRQRRREIGRGQEREEGRERWMGGDGEEGAKLNSYEA